LSIFRGTGGSGDASANATINEVTQLVQDAEGYRTEAASSASNAATSASNASTSASNASTSETNASSSADDAATSAAAALVSENGAAADLALTNADVVLTNADVVLTNADVVSTAASAAAALVSEGLADADATATAADLVATNQDTIDTAADLVATNQDTIDTAADLVLTNADVVLTNADVVLTNADVVSSAASAAAALVSENAAAASAATVPTYDPLTGEALNFVRLNAGETTMEFRTPAEVLSDVGAEAADATILKDADIGVTVQAYDADIPVVVASQAEMEAGTVTANRTMNPAGVKQAIDALASGPAAAISTAFTITSGGLTTWAHGLGARPTKLSGYIKCLTAEDNWSIGDEVEVSIHNNTTTGANRHSSVYTDATNVNMRMSSSASVFSIANKTSGTTSGIVNSRWELYIRAEL